MKDFARAHPMKAAQEAFHALNSHSRPTLETILEDVARVTAKPVTLRTLPGLAGTAATGLWFERDRRHVILQPPARSRHHSDFVRLHEVGHIAFGWLGWAPPTRLSRVDPKSLTIDELIAAAHGHRIDLRTPLEQAAEQFARVAMRAVRSGSTDARNGYDRELR